MINKSDLDICSWLIDNGGPVVRFRTYADLLGETPPDAALRDLLEFEPVKTLLERLKDYGPIERMDSPSLNRIHGLDTLESHIAKLLEYGMRAGLEPFDERMRVFRQYVDNGFVDRAMSTDPGNSADAFRPVIIASIMSQYFVRAGYVDFPAAPAFIKRRIEGIYKAACGRHLDIYLTDEELRRYPKRPGPWSDNPVVRPEFDPYRNITPLPIIHDIYGMAWLPAGEHTPELDDKIAAIIGYIMDPRFRALRRGYGLVYYGACKRYYACGWRPELPDPRGSEYDRSITVLYAELMSRFEAGRNSTWMKECMEALEEYRTERGTYRFPPEMLMDKKGGIYVCGQAMGLGENRRKASALEVESTFRMMLIAANLSKAQDAAMLR